MLLVLMLDDPGAMISSSSILVGLVPIPENVLKQRAITIYRDETYERNNVVLPVKLTLYSSSSSLPQRLFLLIERRVK